MKHRLIALSVLLCLLLSGCSSFLSGEYVFVQPHQMQSSSNANQQVSAETYSQLCDALADMAAAGTEQGVIFIPAYDQDSVETDISRAVSYVKQYDPIAAYAVDNFEITQGTSGGTPALAVKISYLHDRSEIRKIQQVDDNDGATQKIISAIQSFDVNLVLYIKNYRTMDYLQIVESYAVSFPEYVIEQPQVTVNVYPESGVSRVVELKFTYQTSRDSLKEMQTSVRSMFTSAALYISGADNSHEKLSQLYSFMMERFVYTISTSITPAYSLLLHGVGDSRAFATVYAAMCNRSQLECYVVSGTKNGEPYYWNIVRDGENYYHVDLLRCSEEGAFQEFTDMPGYVWDYTAYPDCRTSQPQPESTEPPTEPPAEQP